MATRGGSGTRTVAGKAAKGKTQQERYQQLAEEAHEQLLQGEGADECENEHNVLLMLYYR